MKLNINWKSTLLVICDIVIAGYLFMAFTSWQTPVETAPVCNKVKINIADESENGFLNSQEVKNLLETSHLYPLNKHTSDIDPRIIEKRLSNMPFVSTAECFITKEGHVCITVTQRTPIVRVKSYASGDYYVDDKGGVMPNSQYTSDMIIVTGAVTTHYACKYLAVLAKTIMADDLWKNQIEQINVLPDRTIELIPRVGDHIVNIGQLPISRSNTERNEKISEYVKTQLHRLELFYKYGLSHAGWNRYDYIDLEYSNQIVCRRRETNDMSDMPLEEEE